MQKLNRPELIKLLPQTEGRIKRPLPEADQTWGSRAFGFVSNLGKEIGQSIARSFLATGAEISERIMVPPWEGPRQFGEVSFTPKTDFQKSLFGTDKPVSLRSVGEEVLAIGGEDFVNNFGSAAVPLGMVVATLDVTPIGWGKKATVKTASKTISRTDNMATISKAIKPLFKDASDDAIMAMSRSLKDVRSQKSIETFLSNVGTVKKGSVGVAPTIKGEANLALRKFDDYLEGITIGRIDAIDSLTADATRIKRLKTAGKIPEKDANKMLRGINDQIVETARKHGVATRITKGGNVRLARRESGNFVSDAFKKQAIKDVRPGFGGGTKDITRILQEADGSLTAAQRAARGVGRVESDILRRAQDIMMNRREWLWEKQNHLMRMVDGVSDAQAINANKILTKISADDALKSTAEIARRADISAITKDERVIRLAQESRRYFDDLLEAQNHFRAKRGQKLIPKRDFYSPEQLKKDALWSDAIGYNKDTGYLSRPELPDFINPDKPFIPHELARQANLPEYLKEMNLKQLLENYTNASAKDIFNTSIIQNNKAHIQVLEGMGLPNLSRGIQDWTAEAFTGIRAGIDRKLALSPSIQKGMSWWRNALVKSVFPLNFAWNSFVQTASANFTIAKYGVRNSVSAGFEWFGNPASRKWVQENAYSYIVKTGKSGKMTRQDINKGMADAARINGKSLEKATDAANFFTEGVEKHLTGWSVLAARKDGVRRGLKGDALKWYASDGGAKTQSMYNLEDLPGILRNESVKTAAPFNTFSFEAFNNVMELMGKTGVPPSTQQDRIKTILRFFAGATAINYIGNQAIGREPWQVSSFIPFYSLLFAPIEARLTGDYSSAASTRHLPSPVGIAAEFGQGIERYATKGDIRKLRQASVKYLPGLVGIPAGTQINRTIDGIIAMSEGGVTDSAGRMLFPITEPKDQIRAFFAGPWSTEGGRDYWKKREKNLDTLLKDTKEQWFEGDEERERTPSSIKNLNRPANL